MGDRGLRRGTARIGLQARVLLVLSASLGAAENCVGVFFGLFWFLVGAFFFFFLPNLRWSQRPGGAACSRDRRWDPSCHAYRDKRPRGAGTRGLPAGVRASFQPRGEHRGWGPWVPPGSRGTRSVLEICCHLIWEGTPVPLGWGWQVGAAENPAVFLKTWRCRRLALPAGAVTLRCGRRGGEILPFKILPKGALTLAASAGRGTRGAAGCGAWHAALDRLRTCWKNHGKEAGGGSKALACRPRASPPMLTPLGRSWRRRGGAPGRRYPWG